MKPKDLADRLGNIDEELIIQAETGAGFNRRRPARGLRRAIAIAAAVALMACSFAVGAIAFQPEPETIYLEIEKQLEKIDVGDSGISLILPDSWADKYDYTVAENGSIGVYHLAAREVWPEAGFLFWVERLDATMPVDYEYPQPGYTIATTDECTYVLFRSSDIQYPPDNKEVADEYLELSNSIMNIQVLLSDLLTANSYNQSNWVSGTVTVVLLGSDYETQDTFILGTEESTVIGGIIDSYEFDLESSSYYSDVIIMVDGQEYYMNSVTGQIQNAAWDLGRAILTPEDLETVMAIIDAQR